MREIPVKIWLSATDDAVVKQFQQEMNAVLASDAASAAHIGVLGWTEEETLNAILSVGINRVRTLQKEIPQ